MMILEMMMSEEKKSELIIHSASNLTINFPEANQYISNEEANRKRIAISSQGAYTPDGKAFINKKSLPKVLATDKKGANRFVNDLENDDKMQNGNNILVSVPAVMKEISRRIQYPIDTIKREKLKDSEGCIAALRDSPELEKIKEVQESKIREELPRLKNRKIKAEGITCCQVTNKPLEPNAAFHHIRRRADRPDLALSLDNGILVNPSVHDEIHDQGAESPEELSDFCKKKLELPN